MTGIALGLTLLLAPPAPLADFDFMSGVLAPGHGQLLSGLIAHADKDTPLLWTVESVGPGHAVFLHTGQGSRLDFKRIGDSLTVTLERIQDGKLTRLPFTYNLAAAPPR